MCVSEIFRYSVKIVGISRNIKHLFDFLEDTRTIPNASYRSRDCGSDV